MSDVDALLVLAHIITLTQQKYISDRTIKCIYGDFMLLASRHHLLL